MTLDELHPAILELLAIHSAFQRLGFDASELFATNQGICPRSGHVETAVVLQHGDLSFTATTGHRFVGDREDFRREWNAAVAAWNRASTQARDKVWTESVIYTQRLSFSVALVEKGFRLPARPQEKN